MVRFASSQDFHPVGEAEPEPVSCAHRVFVPSLLGCSYPTAESRFPPGKLRPRCASVAMPQALTPPSARTETTASEAALYPVDRLTTEIKRTKKQLSSFSSHTHKRLIPRIFSSLLHKTEERLIFQNNGLYNFSPDKSQEKNIVRLSPPTEPVCAHPIPP